MGLYEALIEGVAERAQRKDVSRWEKARDMRELQEFLRSQGRAHSLRHLAQLTGVARHTISEQLVIADILTPELLARSGVSPMALQRTPHSTLIRIARLPGPLRPGALRETVGSGETESSVPGNVSLDVRYRARTQVFERLRDEGGFHVSVVEPLRHLSVRDARAHLEQLLPALANFAEVILGKDRSYYVGVTGNGGLFVYLSPSETHGLA